MRTPTLWSLLIISILFGCGKDDSTSSASGSSASGSEQQSGQANAVAATQAPTPQQRAAAAKDALVDELSSKLLAAMSNGGPAQAIEACSQLAPKVAKEIGEQHRVSIGRTSMKLRNAKNIAPQWSEQLIAELPTKPVFTALEKGGTGALFPILLKVQCLTCHGPSEKIASDIRAEITRLYPDDKATGLEEGDLRGWFWVEVPADGDASKNHSTTEDNATEPMPEAAVN